MTIEPFTIHVDTVRDTAVVSRSDAKTRQLTAAEAATAATIADTYQHEYTYTIPSAAAFASVSEAREARPNPSAASYCSGSPLEHGGSIIPIGRLVRRSGMSFDDVLAERRSRRTFFPIDLPSLAYVLASAARVQGWNEADDGFQLVHRPVPSAGGRNPCELVVASSAVSGLDAGLWWFDAVRCVLVSQTSSFLDSAAEKVAAAASVDTEIPASIFVVANFNRTLSRYPAGSTLVWRDAGALLATLQLAATAAGLASCIIGTSGALIQNNKGLIADLGALALGSSPP
jgi:SagB-type dehydrogenase family enzyme